MLKDYELTKWDYLFFALNAVSVIIGLATNTPLLILVTIFWLYNWLQDKQMQHIVKKHNLLCDEVNDLIGEYNKLVGNHRLLINTLLKERGMEPVKEGGE